MKLANLKHTRLLPAAAHYFTVSRVCYLLALLLVHHSHQSLKQAIASSHQNPSSWASPSPPRTPLELNLNNLLTQRTLQRINQTDQLDLKTNHACEGGRMELSCQEGKQIHLVRANYGRFSLSICNEHGFSNYSVICTSFSAFLDVQTMCNNLSNCSVPVSRDLFGDPCPGTTKYLEVQYYCNDVNSQNTGANNGGRATANSVISSTPSTNKPAAPPSGHKSPPSEPPTPAGAENNGVLPERSRPATSRDDSAGLQQTTVMQQQQREQNLCLGQTSARGLVWNATRAGQWARQSCPEGATGRVSWFCEPDRLRFAPALGPDFLECRSIWLGRLSNQLNQMLELPQVTKQQLSSSEIIRQQDEQMIKSILGELSLMAKTKELFAEDLERINIMIGQMVAQLRSLAVLFASSLPPAPQPSWLRAASGSQASNPLVSMYEELFVKLTQVISSLFDWSQRNAWLEMPGNEAREALELSLLEHLKEAGLLLAQSLPSEQLAGMAAVRQANILAAISVIPASPIGDELSWSLAARPTAHVGVQQPYGSFSRLFGAGSTTSGLGESTGELQQAAGELRVPAGLLAGMSANGINKFLLLDIKKADFSLLRNQLAAQASELGAATSQSNFLDLGQPLTSDMAQYQKRIFGVFPISGDSGTPVQLAPWQHKQRHELRAPVSPISVEFRMSPSSISATGAPADNFMQTVTSPEQAPRQCQTLDTNQRLLDQPAVWPSSSAGGSNHCQLTSFNSTNFLCSCWRFGFVALSQQRFAPVGPSGDQFPWQSAESSNPLEQLQSEGRPPYESAPPTHNKQPREQQSYGVLSTIFVVLGAALLIASVGGLAVSVALRLNSRSSLSKKRHGFFDSLAGGPTTGPLATDHNLMGSDPLVSGAATTQSASIIGLNTGAVGSICGATSNYKPHHQQLYAHSPPMLEAYQPPKSWPLQLLTWLVRKPSAWLSGSSGVEAPLGKSDHMIQHRLIGNANSTLLTQHSNGTLAYHKSQYQNGYTTSLGLHQQAQQQQQQQAHLQQTHINSNGSGRSALPLNSSSNSSYVSSSAYYEEIGGAAATTKLNPTSTIVDPFKRPADGSQMSMLNNQQAHLQHQFQAQQQTWSQPTSNSISYSMEQQQQAHQQHQHQQQAHLTMLAKQQHLHTDLSPLQSSSSSSAGGSTTPRHYLFASPSAVNAYKQQQQHQFAGFHQHLHDQ